MDKIEFVVSSESSLTNLFIDGEFHGTFMSKRKAQFYVDGLPKDANVINETTHSGLVSQKNDEAKQKRRGKKKADNDRTRRI